MVYLMNEIKVIKSDKLKQKPNEQTDLDFGKIFSDHMFLMDYDESEGWHDPRIVPYASINLEPSAMCFHYAQEVFEGLKAYKTNDGRILLFRPEKNIQRLNTSNCRLCIPEIDEKLCLEAIKKLVYIDREWVPSQNSTSLYIRPFIFATEPSLGIYPSKKFTFCIICCPVGTYYKNGLSSIKIKVEEKYVKAIKGGTGYIKTGGNYASSLKAQQGAAAENFDYVLWLDGVERRFIEEVGNMNIFFVIDNEIITPELQGSILPGITRLSAIEMLESWGYTVSERRISIDEIKRAYMDGRLKEVFGTGTDAVIAPIREIDVGSSIMVINSSQIGKVAKRLYNNLTSIQFGSLKDNMGWTVEVIK